MQEGPSVRVLLFHPERPVSRAAIDWIADRQRYARVIVPPSSSASKRSRRAPVTSRSRLPDLTPPGSRRRRRR